MQDKYATYFIATWTLHKLFKSRIKKGKTISWWETIHIERSDRIKMVGSMKIHVLRTILPSAIRSIADVTLIFTWKSRICYPIHLLRISSESSYHYYNWAGCLIRQRNQDINFQRSTTRKRQMFTVIFLTEKTVGEIPTVSNFLINLKQERGSYIQI